MALVVTLPPLYAIANVDSTKSSETQIERLLAAGVRFLQIRGKGIAKDRFSEIVSHACQLRKTYPGLKIIVNDSVDVTEKTGADGVHLGQEDGSPLEARTRLGTQAIIGQSTHTRQQFFSAPHQVLNYIAVGPIFSSATKQGHAAVVGLPLLKALCRESPLPVVAIGGLNISHAKEIFEAGASSLACISELEQATDLPSLVQSYEECWRSF